MTAAQALSEDAPVEPTKPPTFQPGEISIGEPVTLPFSDTSTPATGAAVASPATPSVRSADDAAGPGRSGWLGMVVAESNVPGRWRVDEVAPGGPADLAGIRVGDELRAVNGVMPRNADEVSQALTAIVADQPVGIAVARAGEVSDVVVRAAPRPAPSAAPRTAPPPAAPAAGTGAAEQSQGVAPVATTSSGDAATLPSTPPSFATPSVMTPLPAGSAVAAEPGPLPAANAFVPSVTTPDPPPRAVDPGRVPTPPEVALPTPPANAFASVEPTPPSRFMPATPVAPRFRDSAATPSPGLVSPSDVPSIPGATDSPLPTAGRSGPRPRSEAISRTGAAGGRTALGVRTIPIDPVTQARFQLSAPDGAYVIGVVQDLPAFRAGVPPGSVIVALDERPVHSPTELTSLVTSGPVDRPVRVRYVLPGGTSHNTEVVLQPIDPPLLRALVGDATDVPPTVQEPRVARRPIEDSVVTLRREIGVLRESLRRLERRLDDATRTSDGEAGR